MSALRVIAGPTARRQLLDHGLRQEDIRVMVGASGGPKWLALAALDQYLFGEFFADRQTPLHLLGSSSGAWRFVCFARPDSVAASRAFARAYQNIQYPPGMGPAEITRRSLQLLDTVLPDQLVAQQVVNNPVIRLNLIVARARRITAARHRGLQAMGLGLAATANLFHRKALGAFFERVLFHSSHPLPPFSQLNDLPTRNVALTDDNLRAAILASGSIPMVLEGVENIPGAGPGLYYDGGVTDYHFDLPFSQEGLVLYPHFYPRITPGWFDKALRWRKPRSQHYDNVLLVCPSNEWVASLPFGKIPDRRDFSRMSDEQRIAAWGEVIKRSGELAEDFQKLVHGDLSGLEVE